MGLKSADVPDAMGVGMSFAITCRRATNQVPTTDTHDVTPE